MSTKITLRPIGATDSSTDVVLADGSDTSADNIRGPASGSITVAIRDQPFNPIRAEHARFIYRGNRSGTYSFSTSRRFASNAAAGRFMISHGMTCPAAGTLIFDYGDTEETPPGQLGVLFGCVIRQIGELRQSGTVVIGNYSVVFGDSDTVDAADLADEISSHRRGAVAPAPAFVPILVNCGGWAETGWEADRGFSGTTETYRTSAEIEYAVAVPQGVYQCRRTAVEMEYNFPLAAGQYSIRLYFCEIDATEADVNVMDIEVNETAFLQNFDVFAVAGDKDIAHIAGLENITVTDNLKLAFSASTGVAQISGIEIYPYEAPEE